MIDRFLCKGGNMQYRALFLDVDGTLINYHAVLPESARRAVEQARKNGILVFACTGDSKYELSSRNLCTLDGYVLGNGAYVEVSGRVLLHQMISSEDVRRITDWCMERNLGMVLECNDGMFCNHVMKINGPQAMNAYAHGKGKNDAEARQASDRYIGIMQECKREQLYRSDVNKISFLLNSYADHEDSVSAFPDLKAGTWGGRGEEALFGDLSPSGVSKKHGLEVLMHALGLKKEETMAFGDAQVDVPMFEACGFSVAMGNAGKECRQAADYITDDVDQDGLAKAFLHFGLIKE